MKMRWLVVLLVFGLTAAQAAPAALHVECAAFSGGNTVPREFTCDGGDKAPNVSWSGVPTGAKSLALILEDPDAPSGTFTHWILWNIAPAAHSLAGNEKGVVLGRNDFGKDGYGGPCPPHGARHRYYLRVYALDTRLALAAGASASGFHQAIQGHVLTQGETMGVFQH